jgi:hypothetical protein
VLRVRCDGASQAGQTLVNDAAWRAAKVRAYTSLARQLPCACAQSEMKSVEKRTVVTADNTDAGTGAV